MSDTDKIENNIEIKHWSEDHKFLSFIGKLVAGWIFLVLVFGIGYLFFLRNEAYTEVENFAQTINQYQAEGMDVKTWKEDHANLQNKVSSSWFYNQFYSVISDVQISEKNMQKSWEDNLQDQKDITAKELSEFERQFLSYENLGLPGAQTYQDFIVDTESIIISGTKNINLISEKRAQIANMNDDMLSQADKIQRQQLVVSMTDSLKDADKLITFFENRFYADQVKNLQSYKEKVKQATSAENTKSKSYNELQEDYEKNILPYYEKASIKKREIDQQYAKQREKWIREELARRKARGLGEAPKAPLEREKLIYVSLKNQYMYAYDKGELVMSTPITSGKNGFETVTGEYNIYTKIRDRTLISPFTQDKNDPLYYEVDVLYWMPFFSGYGIHDAIWRSSFGGPDYTYNGSHGCINTPLWATEFIWNWAEIGTPVYVQ